MDRSSGHRGPLAGQACPGDRRRDSHGVRVKAVTALALALAVGGSPTPTASEEAAAAAAGGGLRPISESRGGRRGAASGAGTDCARAPGAAAARGPWPSPIPRAVWLIRTAGTAARA